MSANPAHSMPFARLVGVEITSATSEAIEGYLDVRDELCTTDGIIHGGAVMAFADAMGAVGAFVSWPEGAIRRWHVRAGFHRSPADAAGTCLVCSAWKRY